MEEISHRYFAAANGYGGFRSYFPVIFDSRKFDRVFVLKGGPGTGKNTLMRKIAKLAGTPGVFAEEYYCSSDPSSLDGIVLSSGNRRVGVLDGTAPHERDAVVPGAIDTIVNLGENFDEGKLEKRRSEILHLAKRKSDAYKQGYLYLSLAGEADARKMKLPRYLQEQYRETAGGLLSFDPPKGECTVRLKTAFCHLGFLSLPDERTYGKIIRIDGDPSDTYAFTSLLREECEKRDLSFEVTVSPLSENKIESIYFPGNMTLVTRTDEEPKAKERTVLTLPKNPKSTENDVYESCEKACLSKAQAAFSEASRAHFELEEIYKSAMNYKRNEAVAEYLCKRISEILGRP